MNDEKTKSLNEWLVINCQLGDRASFDKLLKAWQPRLLAYAMRRVGDREVAREVVQECLLSVSRGLVSLRDPAAFPGWCFRLLERRCVDALRSRIKEQQKLTEYAHAGSLPFAFVALGLSTSVSKRCAKDRYGWNGLPAACAWSGRRNGGERRCCTVTLFCRRKPAATT